MLFYVWCKGLYINSVSKMQNKMHIFSYWIGEKCKLLTFACIFFQINENLCKSLCFISMFLVIIQLTQWCFGTSGIPRPLEGWRECIFKAPLLPQPHPKESATRLLFWVGLVQTSLEKRGPRGSLPGKFVKMLKSRTCCWAF